VRHVVRHHDAGFRVLDHPHQRGHDGDRDLHGCRVLVRHQAAGFLDTEIGTDPPSIVLMAHEERTQDIGALGDLVVS